MTHVATSPVATPHHVEHSALFSRPKAETVLHGLTEGDIVDFEFGILVDEIRAACETAHREEGFGPLGMSLPLGQLDKLYREFGPLAGTEAGADAYRRLEELGREVRRARAVARLGIARADDHLILGRDLERARRPRA